MNAIRPQEHFQPRWLILPIEDAVMFMNLASAALSKKSVTEKSLVTAIKKKQYPTLSLIELPDGTYVEHRDKS